MLTDPLWDLTYRCLEQDPRRRPEITEVARDLHRTLVAREDLADVTDTWGADDTTLGSVQERKSSCRASSLIAPFQLA